MPVLCTLPRCRFHLNLTVIRSMNYKTPIIIPVYEPDERLLLDLLHNLLASEQSNVIVVDDGSGDKYSGLFSEVKKILAPDGVLISYRENKGKGWALKVAFAYVLENMLDVEGVITIDPDGKHSVECILNVERKFLDNPGALVLGVRSFDNENIPWHSKIGNKLTKKILKYVSQPPR